MFTNTCADCPIQKLQLTNNLVTFAVLDQSVATEKAIMDFVTIDDSKKSFSFTVSTTTTKRFHVAARFYQSANSNCINLNYGQEVTVTLTVEVCPNPGLKKPVDTNFFFEKGSTSVNMTNNQNILPDSAIKDLYIHCANCPL